MKPFFIFLLTISLYSNAQLIEAESYTQARAARTVGTEQGVSVRYDSMTSYTMYSISPGEYEATVVYSAEYFNTAMYLNGYEVNLPATWNFLTYRTAKINIVIPGNTVEVRAKGTAFQIDYIDFKRLNAPARDTPVLYGDIPFDSIPAKDKDTVMIYMNYVDTTMTEGMRTIKVNGVYKNFKYRFPVDPVVKHKVGYGVKLKKDASEVALINPHKGDMYHGFTFGKYLDEILQPLAKKYMVTLAISLKYNYGN